VALTELCYCRQNATSSGNDSVLTKFLTTPQSVQQSSSTLDSPVRGVTDISIEKLVWSGDDLHDRSKCRWTYKNNIDPNRVPRTLPEARCSQLHLPRMAGQCERVWYYIPVKRRKSGVWIDDWLWFPVGCTLARPIISPPITFD